MRFTLENIKKCMDGLKEDLGEGFIETDIWSTTTDKSVAFFHQHQYGAKPKHLKVFGETSRKLKEALRESYFPGIGDYYLIALENNRVAVIINYSSEKSVEEFQQYVLVDLSKVTIGVLMSVAIPKVLEIFK